MIVDDKSKGQRNKEISSKDDIEDGNDQTRSENFLRASSRGTTKICVWD